MFSAMLMALQCGLLLGMFSYVSLPIDYTPAHIWVGGPNIRSLDLGRPIPEGFLARLAGQPEVGRAEGYVQAFTHWLKPDGSQELCMVVGSRLEDDALGAVRHLTPELRRRLSEPGAVVLDDSDLDRLGVSGVGAFAQIHDHRVRVVGLVHGARGMAGAFIFCSVETARSLLRLPEDRITYALAVCRDTKQAPEVVARLRAAYPGMTVFTSEEFSFHSRLHWLTKTKAGIALAYTVALGLMVGTVVTAQTLYAATAASLREFAVLWALGIPVWRMARLVLAESFCAGTAGTMLALPAAVGLARVASLFGAMVLLPLWLVVVAGLVTLGMALLSGLAPLRLLWRLEPGVLLRGG
jgi:putative ABC transport system permease protein